MPKPPAPPDLLPKGQRQRLLLRLLRSPGDSHLRRMLARSHPADVAELVPVMPPDDVQRLLELLFELKLAARVLRELDPETQKKVIAGLPDASLANTLPKLSADDAVDLLGQLEEGRREGVLGLLDRPLAQRLGNLMLYGESTAGGLMNPDVVSFREDQTVGETLALLRRLASTGRLFYLYIVDDHGHLNGLVNLWQLITAEAERALREVMSGDVVKVRVDTPQEEVALVFSRYDLLMVPVVDHEGILVGAITVDDVLDVVEEEATEDLYRLANLDTQENLSTPTSKVIRLRMPWLMVNLVTAFVAAGVVKLFEDTIARVVVLAVFMPIVAGMGGNAGTQTLTVLVRGLALGEMDLRRPWAVILRQVIAGFVNGLANGTVCGLAAYAMERNVVLSLILVTAMTANLTIAGLFGALVPLVLQRLKLDPALGSSIFVTTATDVGGFMSFLGIATLLIKYLQP
jgi:magnesium transporter